MSTSVPLRQLLSPKCYTEQLVSPSPSQFLASKSILRLKKQTLLYNTQDKRFGFQRSRCVPVVSAAQTNLLRVIQTVWKVGKDGIETGTNLVPGSVPRPVARISVTIAAVTISLFLVKSFLSTAFFVLATMGLIYFTFIAFNKDEGPRGGGGASATSSTEDSLDEARRIMEKYK